jgi:hypothetical protein
MSTTPATPAGGAGNPVVEASDLVAQRAKQWNVSGTSVLVAWGLAVAGGVSITIQIDKDKSSTCQDAHRIPLFLEKKDIELVFVQNDL